MDQAEEKQAENNRQQTLLPAKIEKTDRAYSTVNDIIYRLKKKDAKNIAITGPYGSGKSSIIKTLIEDYPQYHYLHISLATLESYSPNVESNKKNVQKKLNKTQHANGKLNRLIEYSILQQLIYREKQEVIPHSRFKRIFHIPSNRVKRLAFAFVLFIVTFFIAFEPQWGRVESIYNFLDFGGIINTIFDLVSIIYMLFVLFFITKYLIFNLCNNKLNKLNLKDCEIEIVEQTSIFNKHLDEIIYFFQVTNYDVVIIEDLDRFGTSDIFLKLRELNQLLNESKAIERPSNQPIVFIYAIKDDLFKNSDRSKFFDYITTVIPVINPSNSKDKLKEALEKQNVTTISDNDLKELAFFINDMRLLVNIVNEFKQYWEKIGGNLKPENLLAMIIYKNYHPDDFAALHQCAGKVYTCITQRRVYDKILSSQYDDQIDEIRNKINSIKKAGNIELKELRMVYLFQYIDKLPRGTNAIQINNGWHSFATIANNENLFEALIREKDVKYRYTDRYYVNNIGSEQILFSDIEKEINPLYTYEERKDASFTIFYNRLEEITQKKLDIHTWTLKRVLEEIDLKNCTEYQSIQLTPLMEFFIQRGYLDEEYYDYISYFYPNMITKEDREFLLNAKLKKNIEYNYHIKKVGNVIPEIPNYVYRTNSILNNDILDFIANNISKYNVEWEWRLKRIIQISAFKFLIQYYQLGHEQEIVFRELFLRWETFWEEMQLKKEEESWYITEAWLRFCPIDKISSENFNQWMTLNFSFISDRVNIIDLKRIKSILMKCESKMQTLNVNSKELLDFIIQHQMFVLTIDNVCLITNYLLKTAINKDDLNLSCIYRTGDNNFIDYVENNLEYCLQTLFSHNNKNEEEHALLRIINNCEINDEIKRTYLQGQSKNIEYIKDIDDKFKQEAIELYIVKPIWMNISAYYDFSDKVLTEELFNYISHYSDLLSRVPFPKNDDNKISICRELMATNRMLFDIYSHIGKSFDCIFETLDLSGLEARRMEHLIVNKKLAYTEYNTKILSSHFPTSLLGMYLIIYKDNFISDIDKIPYTQDLIFFLLGSQQLTNIEKKELISILSIDLVNNNILLANLICNQLRLQMIDLDHTVLLEVLKNSTDLDLKLFIVNQVLLKVECNESLITNLLKTLPEPYSNMSKRKRHPLLPNNEIVSSIVRLLEDNNYISSFSTEKKGIRVHTKMLPN